MQVYERILPCDLSFVNIFLSKNDISEFRPWHLNLLILIPGKRSDGCRSRMTQGKKTYKSKQGEVTFSLLPLVMGVLHSVRRDINADIESGIVAP